MLETSPIFKKPDAAVVGVLMGRSELAASHEILRGPSHHTSDLRGESSAGPWGRAPGGEGRSPPVGSPGKRRVSDWGPGGLPAVAGPPPDVASHVQQWGFQGGEVTFFFFGHS